MHDPSWPAGALAAVTHHDPYPYYAALAQAPALLRDEPSNLWVAAHPATVREVMAHPDCHVRPSNEPVPVALAGGPAGDLFGALVRMNDGAPHAQMKAALRQALALVAAEEVMAHAKAIVALHAVHDAATLNDFVFNVPVQTVASLLGCPPPQLPAIAWAAGRFVAGLARLASPAQVDAAHDGARVLVDAMRRLVEAAPARGLVAEVRRALPPDGDSFALCANLAGLLTQTCEATAGLLGNCIVARLRGAGDGAKDVATGGAVGGITGGANGSAAEGSAALVARVAECDPAIHNTRRFAARDVTIAGTMVRAGDAMLLILVAGQPFGSGRHACPGARLAHSIVAAALPARAALPAVSWRYCPAPNARMPHFIDKETP
ncbi:cytochrome P450 [Pseudoduganella lurida]|uniref:Cytochrome P450 n=1 Tax=Pseudoduganella lurida TaxID=1036180 RepID=A0A562R3A5_9BURK|nr:cytochrome P450 [Pseudoduganella lurida]TWI63547.1 cytochrome P450 [Pseudoduganella lurida]